MNPPVVSLGLHIVQISPSQSDGNNFVFAIKIISYKRYFWRKKCFTLPILITDSDFDFQDFLRIQRDTYTLQDKNIPLTLCWFRIKDTGPTLDQQNASVSCFLWLLLAVVPLKWNESGFRPPLCTYRLNWARRTSWGWWDDWDDTVLQTQDSKFEPWRSEAEHATSRSQRLPTILTFTRGWGRNNFVSFKPPRPGTEPRTLAWKAAVLTTTLGPPPCSAVEAKMQYMYMFTFKVSRYFWFWKDAYGLRHCQCTKRPTCRLAARISHLSPSY